MKFILTIIMMCLLWICESRHLSGGCRDMYVWIAGGSVDCKYLYIPSSYGLHRRPEYFCKSYPLTYCCDTCKNIVSGKTSPKPTKGPITTSTRTEKTTTSTRPTSTENTTISTRRIGTSTSTTKTINGECRDKYVWIADGSVNCKYLYTPSFYGLHRRPEYFCKDYPLTYCCDTCTNIVSGKTSPKPTNEPKKTPTSTTVTTSTRRIITSTSSSTRSRTSTSTGTKTLVPPTTKYVSSVRTTTTVPPTHFVSKAPERLNVFDIVIQALEKPASP